jgi:putative FmdB family regulatory protein
MPTYHYRCSDCEHSFDFFQKFADDPLTECPECGGTIRRVLQPVGIVFKGSGWYVTDSRENKTSTSAPKTESGDKAADSSASPPKESSDKKAPATVGES